MILDLPVSSYSIGNLREFIGMNEEDKILISVAGHYQYGDLDYETGGELLDSFQITRFAPEGFEYFFNQKRLTSMPIIWLFINCEISMQSILPVLEWLSQKRNF